jgi:dipeptidyl aminopeptidase/acylaminoacyl peptidase
MRKRGAGRTVEPADLFRIKSLLEAKLSPDGGWVVYTVSRVEGDQESAVLWLLSLETGASWQLTDGPIRDFSPAWSPDGREIAFLSIRGGPPQVYVVPVDGGEPRAITASAQGVGGGPAWSPDGRSVAFTAGPPIAPPDPSQPYRTARAIWRFDGVGYLDNMLQDIYVVPAEGGSPRQLTSDVHQNLLPTWSPDGQELLFTSMLEPDSHSVLFTFKAVDLEGKVRDIAKNVGLGQTATWTPDGSRIVFTGTPDELPLGYKSEMWVVNRDGSGLECRTAALRWGVNGQLMGDFPAPWIFQDNPVKVSRDGTKAYLHVKEGGSKHIYAVGLHGPESWTPVVVGERACAFMDLDDKHLLYAVSTMNSPGELFVADLDGRNERQLTHLNEELVAEWELPAVEHLRFSSSDGQSVEGWIMKPAVGEAPYPTILYIPGGPYAGFGHIYSFDFQMLAGAGYAVLFVNQRGCSGYGDEFSTRILGDWGHLDYEDLMAGIDFVVEKGIADPDRLGVCGLSGGGYLTCWIVGHTERFKAAVPENPVTDFLSFYGVSDVGPTLCSWAMGGRPDEVPEAYRRSSPVTYAHKCRTPTLLVTGAMDLRCPSSQAEEFYTILKANKCVAEMVRLPNSSHLGSILGLAVARRAQNEVLLHWMNRYVLGLRPAG